jgi:hypothetical protein
MLSFLFFLAFAGAAVFLAIGVHEVGHILGGWLGGLRFAVLCVGPLDLRREADGRLRWRFNTTLGGALGFASCLPVKDHGLRRSYLKLVAAGPVTSLAVGVLVLAVYTLSGLLNVTETTHGPTQSSLALSVFLLGVFSVALGVGTLLPISPGGFVNDGLRLLKLSRPSPVADRHAAVMALGAYLMAGRRPRSWDAGVVAQALSLADGSYDDLQGRYLAYFRALDREDPQAAGEHVQYMVDHAAGAPPAFRPVIAMEAAYFDAAHRGDAASARERLEGAGTSPFVDADDRGRVEGAVLLAEGDTEGAYEKLRVVHESLSGQQGRGGESVLAEVERLLRAGGLPTSEPHPIRGVES